MATGNMIHSRCRGIFAALALLSATTAGAADSFAIRTDSIPDLILQDSFRSFVKKSAEDIAGDLERVFGKRPMIRFGSDPAATNAIVLARAGDGWENYTLETLPDNILRITGSDDRGVMFGLYRFASDCLGVDPYYHWSGVEPERATCREWKDGISLRQGDPSFRFRGWFVNDEDFLNGFRPDENGHRSIDYPRYHVCFGPSLADKVCETAVRAGFNLMVCASYVDILNPDEKRLVDIAASRGLYITMHHQEPVGASALFLDLHFPEMKGTTYASHPELWRKGWRAYVNEWAKVPDVIWQLGLRGRKDRPFWAVMLPNGKWSDWGADGEDEDRRRAQLIAAAMNDQLGMIREAMGERPFRTATQLWMEGADFFRRGMLEVPQGTIVMFSDNSPGAKFQPDLGGVDRLEGGRPYGLYYHLAVVIGNHHCELVPPFRTREILADAYQKGACELVLFNVSNVRPFVYTIAAAGEMSRNLSAFDAGAFQHAWTTARFGDCAGRAISRAIDLYFAAYETELSRDAVSSYGSPRLRAPLAILNDGVLYETCSALLGILERSSDFPSFFVSPYVANPDELMDVSASRHHLVNQDMYPHLKEPSRIAARARAQAAGFERCLDQIEFADTLLDAKRKRLLFERFGYPAGFMREASLCCSELALAAAAHVEGNRTALRRHLERAWTAAKARDALDCRYDEGGWANWHRRNIIYPYPKLTTRIARMLNDLPSVAQVSNLAGDATRSDMVTTVNYHGSGSL